MQELSDKLRRGLQLAEQRRTGKKCPSRKTPQSRDARWKSDLRLATELSNSLQEQEKEKSKSRKKNN